MLGSFSFCNPTKLYFGDESLNYLNTELVVGGSARGHFSVTYFDSADNRLIQVADIFANLLYSEEQTGQYGRELGMLRKAGMLKYIFDFPKMY